VEHKDATLNDWQIAETIKALSEADRDEFATEDEVQKVLRKLSLLAL
jgi:predicted transcriptional regulator